LKKWCGMAGYRKGNDSVGWMAPQKGRTKRWTVSTFGVVESQASRALLEHPEFSRK
jgi:hypothetical protein